MYVAITRAKRYLHMSYSDTRSTYGQQETCKPSQFISEIPNKLVMIWFRNYELKRRLFKENSLYPEMTQDTFVKISNPIKTQ